MRCVWASIDENGRTHGGKAGNQTGKELKFGAYYSFGQNYLIRPKNTKIAPLIADAANTLALNKNIGYDQYQRETLYVLLEKAKWNASGVKDLCECDCSELAVCAINCAYKKEVLPADTYSGNLASRAVKTGLFEKIDISKATIKQGDIIIAPGKHVIIAVGTLSQPASGVTVNDYAVGKVYTLRGNMNVRAGAGTNQRIKKVSELTADGKKHCVNKSSSANAVLAKGTRVTCKKVVVNKSGDIWLQIPSGYVCAYSGGKRYVY